MKLTISAKRVEWFEPNSEENPGVRIKCRTLTGRERAVVHDGMSQNDDGDLDAEFGSMAWRVCRFGVLGWEGLDIPFVEGKDKLDLWSEELLFSVFNFIWDGCNLNEEKSGNLESPLS